jgi:hypothetical protein
LAGGLSDVSYGFTQAARSKPDVLLQVVRKCDTEKIHNFEIFIFFELYSDDIKEKCMVGAYCTCERLGNYTKC